MDFRIYYPEGGYLFAKNEQPKVTFEIEHDYNAYKTIRVTLHIISFDKTYEKEETVEQTLKARGRTLMEVPLDCEAVGNYQIFGTATCDGDSISVSTCMAIVEAREMPPAKGYNWKLPVGKDAVFTSKFDAVPLSPSAAPVPGKSRNRAYYAEKTQAKAVSFAQSLLSGGNLKYCFQNEKYAYAITQDGKEVIAFKEANGYTDVLSGGGKFKLVDPDGNPIQSAGAVIDYETSMQEGEAVVRVRYAASAGANFETTYLLRENDIDISARVIYDGEMEAACEKSVLARDFINGYVDVKKTFHCDWVYPYDDDFPYKYIDSWITVNSLDADHRVYTFTRKNIFLKRWDYYVRYPETDIPLNFENGKQVDYTLHYNLVLEQTDAGRSDYYALFEGKNADFAAGIAPVLDNDDNTTLFVADEVALNLNVTNLVQQKTKYSVRYDIRDYYGNVVDAGIFLGNELAMHGSANRQLKVSAKQFGYGIYFLNFMVATERYQHREYYSFALLDHYTYRHNATSPFGINQVIGDEDVPFSDSYSLFNKVGVAVTRGGFISRQTPELSYHYLKLLREKGIRIVAHGCGNQKIYDDFGDYFEDAISGNELNLQSINGNKTVEQTFDDYYEEFYHTAHDLTVANGKNNVIAGVSGGQTAWYEEFYKRGLWNDFQKISLHVYGIPYAPDNKDMLGNIWSVEGGMIRTKEALERFGKKPVQIHETGYHTAPIHQNGTHTEQPRSNLCLRTQADYNIRCYILGLAYGAELVSAYCMYDYSNGGVGTLIYDMEYHFGNFYYPDYFGRILPKPVSIAYANMTRQLESITSIVESERYSKGTVRAFEVETTDNGKILVAWSNCAPLPNDSGSPQTRKPSMPWQNQWQGMERIFVRAAGDHVTVVDLMGHEQVCPVHGRSAHVRLTGSPVFIKGVL